MSAVLRRVFRLLILVCLVLGCVVAPAGCSCEPDRPPMTPQGPIACRTHTPKRPTAPGGAPGIKTVPAGSIPGTFAVTSTGEATYVMPLVTVPGRAGVEPQLAVTYDSAAGDGVLGVGFSLAGLSAITRCPSNLAQDGEIRDVRYDSADKICLDGKRLVVVGQAPGTIEYRTFPDTFVKVIGHYPPEGGSPADALSFEAFMPSGLVLEYGNSESGKPLSQGGVPRAWLATRAHDGRGNAMTYAYCFAAGDDYTAEYALDEIRYTSFDGVPALAPSRAVQFVYGTKDPADVRTLYAGGMALQSSLRLDAIQMLGPGDTLVRRYGFTYGLGPTTHRTLLTQVEECASDGVCKPPTRFSFSSSAAGFKRITTNIPTPTSVRASPMLHDIDGDGLDDLVLPDTHKALSTPVHPITEWHVA
jgi:hypothetical protein